MVCFFESRVRVCLRVEDVLFGAVSPSAAPRTDYSVRVQQRAAVRNHHRGPAETGLSQSCCGDHTICTFRYMIYDYLKMQDSSVPHCLLDVIVGCDSESHPEPDLVKVQISTWLCVFCRNQVLWVCIFPENPWSSTAAQKAAARQPSWTTQRHCGWGVQQHGRSHILAIYTRPHKDIRAHIIGGAVEYIHKIMDQWQGRSQ